MRKTNKNISEAKHYGYDDYGYSLRPGHDEGEPQYNPKYDIAGGRNYRSGYNSPSYQKTKPQLHTIYFFDVPEDQETLAQSVGLKQTKSGKWGLIAYNTSSRRNILSKRMRAEKYFGKPKEWTPKKDTVQSSVPSTLAPTSNTVPVKKGKMVSMYFFSVPADKETTAKQLGLTQTKSGKWGVQEFENSDPKTIQAAVNKAESVLGKSKKWSPKTSTEESLADMDVTIQSFGNVDPGFADDPAYKIVVQGPGGKKYRFKDKNAMNKLFRGKADTILSGQSEYKVLRNDLNESRMKDLLWTYAENATRDEFVADAAEYGMSPREAAEFWDEVNDDLYFDESKSNSIHWPDGEVQESELAQTADNAIQHFEYASDAYDHLVSMAGKYIDWVRSNKNDLIDMFKNYGLASSEFDETISREKDMDDSKPVIVKGVKGMNSKPFTKKFKNQAAYEKWADSDASDDYEVKQVMNESKDTVQAAAQEIFGALFQGGIGQATDLNNYINKVMRDHGLRPADRSQVISMVKKQGYTGDLLDESNIDGDQGIPGVGDTYRGGRVHKVVSVDAHGYQIKGPAGPEDQIMIIVDHGMGHNGKRNMRRYYIDASTSGQSAVGENADESNIKSFKRIDDFEVWNDQYVMGMGAEYDETHVDGKLVGVAVTSSGVRGIWYNKERYGTISSATFSDALDYVDNDPNAPELGDPGGSPFMNEDYAISKEISTLKKLAGLAESFGEFGEMPTDQATFSQTKRDGDNTVTISATGKTLSDIQRMMKLAGLPTGDNMPAVIPEPMDSAMGDEEHMDVISDPENYQDDMPCVDCAPESSDLMSMMQDRLAQ